MLRYTMFRQIVMLCALIFVCSGQVYSQTKTAEIPVSAAQFRDLLVSAENGDTKDQFLVGSVYLLGERFVKGVQRDDDKAKYWYTKSALQGLPIAQFLLSSMYIDGQGVAQYFKPPENSAEQGDVQAEFIFASMYYGGIGTSPNYARAKYWFEKLIAKNNALGQYGLGTMYFEGNGVKQDFSKARFWFEKSAEQGFMFAQYYLADLYLTGKGGERDIEAAKYWLKRSCDNNKYPEACDRYQHTLLIDSAE